MSDSSGSEHEEQQLLLQYLALFTFAAGAAALAYGLTKPPITLQHSPELTGSVSFSMVTLYTLYYFGQNG
jgi:hypothetical protein